MYTQTLGQILWYMYTQTLGQIQWYMYTQTLGQIQWYMYTQTLGQIQWYMYSISPQTLTGWRGFLYSHWSVDNEGHHDVHVSYVLLEDRIGQIQLCASE